MSRDIYIISVFIHVVSACIWLGGMMFLILAFIPGVKNHPDKVNLIAAVSLKFRKAGIVVLSLLLITGYIQLEFRGIQWNLEYLTNNPFGKIAAFKILIFICIACLSLIHDYYLGTRAIEAWKSHPDHPKTIKLRNLSRMAGRISFLLALLAVFLGVILVR